jgi:hypothetical protein
MWTISTESCQPTKFTVERYREWLKKIEEESSLPAQRQYWIMGPNEYEWWLNYLNESW